MIDKAKRREISRRYYVRNKAKIYANIKAYRKTYRGYVTLLVTNIRQRCTNTKGRPYPTYKTVKICFTSEELYRWLVLHEIDPRGLDIHRIQFDGNYSLDNIEFLTKGKHTRLHNLRGH